MIAIGIDPGVTEVEAAYFAGLIDGEGYLGIARREPGTNRCVTPKYTVRLSVAMTDMEPLQAMVNAFSLRRPHLKRGQRHQRWKTCYTVDVENDDAARIAATVRPYLLIKQRQADLICEMRRLQTRSRRDRMEPHSTLTMQGGRNKGSAYTVLRLSVEYLAKCETLYLQARRLNEKGAGQCSISA